MYTQCPGCATIFTLRAWQLQRARGQVTCGLCQTTFDAFDGLSEELPGQASAGPETPADPGRREEVAREGGDRASAQTPSDDADSGVEAEPAGRPAASDGEPAAEGTPESAPRREGTESSVEPEGLPDRGELRADQAQTSDGLDDTDWEAILAEVRGEQRGAAQPEAPKGRSWLRRSAYAVVALLLFGGVVHGSYLYRDALIDLPGARAWLGAVCAVYGCQLESAESYAVIEIEERFLERHPRRDDALMLGGVLVHAGERRLPFPEMRLILRDLDGHVTGQRWVQPADYVADSRLRARLDAGMEPGARVPVRVSVAEPEGGAESFSLEFRPAQSR